MTTKKPVPRKPFIAEPGYLSGLRKGAGRAWVVAYKIRNGRYRVECKAHGESQDVTTSAGDAKALVRAVRLWCSACARDAMLFDHVIKRGDLRYALRSQTDPWDRIRVEIDVLSDSHPAFLVHCASLEAFIPEKSGITNVAQRMLSLCGSPGHGEKKAKRFTAEAPIAEAQAAIVFAEHVIAHLSVIPKSAAAEAHAE